LQKGRNYLISLMINNYVMISLCFAKYSIISDL